MARYVLNDDLSLSGADQLRVVESELNKMFAEIYGQNPQLVEYAPLKITASSTDGTVDPATTTHRKMNRMLGELGRALGLNFVPPPYVADALFGRETIRQLNKITELLYGEHASDAKATFNISDKITKAEGNSGRTGFVFDVTRTDRLDQEQTLDWRTGGTGTSQATGDDFEGGFYPTGTILFPIGATSAQITVWVKGDTVLEPNEDFFVQIYNALPAANFGKSLSGGTITNDEVDNLPPPLANYSISSNVTKNEGNSGITAYDFLVYRTGRTDNTSTIAWRTESDPTAPSQTSDFADNQFQAGVLTFSPGETQKQLTVNVQGDTTVETNENFKVILSSPNPAANITRDTAIGTINNDDTASSGNPPAGNAAFTYTSPATYSQPNNSTKYQRLAATVPVTFSKKAGANADKFDLNGTILSLRPQAYQAGGSNTYTVGIRATDATGAQKDQDVTVTVSNMEAPVSASFFYDADFSGPADTKLGAGSVEGWANYPIVTGYTPTSNDGPILDGNGRVVVTNYWANQQAKKKMAALYNPGPGAGKLTFSFTNAPSRLNMIVLASPATLEYIQMNVLYQDGRGFSTVDYVKDGVRNQVSTGGGDMGMDAIDQSFTFEYDENTKVLRVASSVWGGHTVDLSAYNLQGRMFGIGGEGPFGFTEQTITDVRYTRSDGILTVVDVPNLRPSNEALYRLRWQGLRPSRLQHRWINPLTGMAVTDWATGDSVFETDVSDREGFIQYTATAPSLSALRPQFRYYNDIAVIGSTSLQTAFGVVLPPVTFGVNIQNGAYYDGVHILEDWGKVADFRGPIEATEGFTSDVVYIPIAGITGTWNVTTEVGVSFQRSNIEYAMEVVSSDPATGKHVLRITDDQPPSNGNYPHRRFQYTTTLKRRPRIFSVKNSDGYTGEWNRQFLTRMKDFSGFRTLNLIQTNSPWYEGYNTIADDQASRAGTGLGNMAIEQVCRLATVLKTMYPATFEWVHFTEFTINVDALVRDNAVKFRDGMPQGVMLIHELGNENWSIGFRQQTRAGLDAFREGLWGNSTPDNPNPKVPILMPINGQNPGYTDGKACSPVMKKGDGIWANLNPGGYNVFRALKDVPAGQDLKVSEYFERIGGYDEVSYGGMRWFGWRHRQIIDIYKDVYGDTMAQRVQFGIWWQVGENVRRLDIQRFDPWVRDYDSYLTYLGNSCYVYDGQAENPNATGDLIVQKMIDGVQSAIANQRNWIKAVTDEGKLNNMYEGGLHSMYFNTGNGAYLNAWKAAEDNPRLGLAEYDWTKAIMTYGSGRYNYFSLDGLIWGLYKNSSVYSASKRIVGHMAARNGKTRAECAALLGVTE